MHGKQTDQGVNCDSSMACCWPQSVAQVSVWSYQVWLILVDYIWEQNQVSYIKDTWIPSNIFGLFRDRGGKVYMTKYQQKFLGEFPE